MRENYADHQVAKVFRDGTKGVSKEHVARAAKLLDALAAEGTGRGYEVTLPSSHKRTNSRGTTTLDGDIAITIGTTTVPLAMRELPPNGGAARPYIPKYNSRDQSWTLGNNTDFVSTGRLQLELTQKYSTNGRQERFRDGKRQQFDIALPAILREIEIQHRENEWKREQARLKSEETQQRWEAAVERSDTNPGPLQGPAAKDTGRRMGRSRHAVQVRGRPRGETVLRTGCRAGQSRAGLADMDPRLHRRQGSPAPSHRGSRPGRLSR
jgi:hypothetical protein